MYRRRLVLLAASAFALLGCDFDGFGDSQRFKEDFLYTHRLNPGGRVSLENFNGSVEIVGSDRDSIEIAGTKYAATEELLDAIRIEVDSTDAAIRIRTVRPYERRGNSGARYRIRLPRKIELERINTSNGAVSVQSIEGNARLRTSNASVKAIGVKGDVDAQTSNGGIDLDDVEGGCILKTSNAGVRAERIRGGFEATSSNGGIQVELLNEPNRTVRLDTSNAGITLRMPAASAARVRARTSNGSVSSDFDVRRESGEKKKSSLDGEIGTGGPLLDLSTSNGNIRIGKL
ncbi:MAG: DUF4097 family beta strand repeat-containing protein [Bryobacteraceae bacterium]